MKTLKPYILFAFTILLLVVMIVVRLLLGGMNTASNDFQASESFSSALWNSWGISIIIIAFIIFAGGSGILVLLGGGWRWE